MACAAEREGTCLVVPAVANLNGQLLVRSFDNDRNAFLNQMLAVALWYLYGYCSESAMLIVDVDR